MAAGLMAAALPALGSKDVTLKLNDLKVEHAGDELVVAFRLDPRDVNPGRNSEVTFTPVIRSKEGTDSVVMPSVKVAGRNRYYWHERNHDLPESDKYYYARDRKPIDYRAEIPFQKWMEQSEIDMRQTKNNCCSSAKLGPDTPLAELNFTPPVYTPAFRFVELTGDSAIVLQAEGRAYVDYVVNRTEIRPDYRRNKRELAKIIASIDKVKNDPDAVITNIFIKGFASPEGSYENNVRLAMGRTASLKDYVKNHYKFREEIMSTDYEPEDWDGLRQWVLGSNISHKQEILDIINSDLAPDPRNTAIQTRFPKEYKVLLDSVYPGLRHSDYTVKYRIKAYATVEELMAAYKKSPERLRPVDFQRIAAQYPKDSKEYRDIMQTAVKIHPNDSKANLNAATIALRDGDLQKAQQYLDKAGASAEAVYSRATLAGMNGDLERAGRLFEQAAGMGMSEAAAQAEAVKALRNVTNVTYLINN